MLGMPRKVFQVSLREKGEGDQTDCGGLLTYGACLSGVGFSSSFLPPFKNVRLQVCPWRMLPLALIPIPWCRSLQKTLYTSPAQNLATHFPIPSLITQSRTISRSRRNSWLAILVWD